jgi:nitrogen fixation/metabolism regulation signal transduction histidine kinase
MLAVGLLPLLAWGVVSGLALGQIRALSLSQVEQVLAEAEEALAGPVDPARAEAVRERARSARLGLATIEVARTRIIQLEERLLWGVLGGTALLLAVLALVVGRALSRPIAQLTAGMAEVARGDLSHRLPRRGSGPPSDELSYLADAFNRMADELVAQRDRLRATEQLAAWRDVARAMAHELKNPLTAMKMSLARLSRAPGPAAAAEADSARLTESVAVLEEEVAVLMRMTHSFSEFARLPAAERRPVDLGALAREVAAVYGAGPVALDVQAPRVPIMVAADPDQLRRALGNLMKNAVEASRPEDGPVRVVVSAAEGRARVRIADGGSGIPTPMEGAQLLAGLSSTKPGGSGLGLPLTHRILVEHGGSLRLEPASPRGTVALVDLPVSAP